MEVYTESILPVWGEITIVPGVSLGEPWRMARVETITIGRAYSALTTASAVWMDPILAELIWGNSKSEIRLEQDLKIPLHLKPVDGLLCISFSN